MINSILEKVKMLRTLAVDITNCEYYGEDDAVLGNLVPADIVNALDLLTESLRNEITEIEKQEPIGEFNGVFGFSGRAYFQVTCFDALPTVGAKLYASPVQQSPAVAQQRITEQDAREIVDSYCSGITVKTLDFNVWTDEFGGKTLLAKLNEHREPELSHRIEQAHMAGQIFAGIDPSYSEAKNYCQSILSTKSPSAKTASNDR